MAKGQRARSEMTSVSNKRGRGGENVSLTWFVQVFLVLMLVWVALNGLSGFAAGLPAALIAAAIGTWFVRSQPYPWRPLRWLVFGGFFLLESIKGGSDVAWRAMHPALKIQPEFVRHAIDLPDGLPTTLLTSLLSLLPGTLSVRLFEDDRVLVVHALTPAAVASTGRLERMLGWVFEPSDGKP